MSGDVTRECEKLRESLPEYAEGRLEGRLRARLEKHLAECSRCVAEVDDLRTVIGAVRALGTEETPEDLIPRVRRAAQERVPAPAGVGLPWARLAVPVAALTAVIAVAFALRAPVKKAFVPGAGMVEMARQAPAATMAEPEQLADGAAGEAEIEIAQSVDAPGGLAVGAEEGLAQRPEVREQRSFAPDDSEVSYQEESAPPPPATVPRESKQMDNIAAVPATEKARSSGMGGGAPRMGKDQPKPPIERELRRDRAGRDGGQAGNRIGGPYRPTAARETFAADAEEPAKEPPFSARATLASGAGGTMIALQLASDQPLHEITVSLGDASPQEHVWQGAAEGPAWIPVTADVIGAGPAAIPVRLTAGQVSREYVLFVPVMARLGESAPIAPVGTYEGQSLEKILGEFTALTGLVVLAERPLDTVLSREMRGGKPGEVLEQVAADAGFEAHAEGALVYTLTRRR